MRLTLNTQGFFHSTADQRPFTFYFNKFIIFRRKSNVSSIFQESFTRIGQKVSEHHLFENSEKVKSVQSSPALPYVRRGRRTKIKPSPNFFVPAPPPTFSPPPPPPPHAPLFLGGGRRRQSDFFGDSPARRPVRPNQSFKQLFYLSFFFYVLNLFVLRFLDSFLSVASSSYYFSC